MRRFFWKAANAVERFRGVLLRLQSKLEKLSELRPTGSMYYLSFEEIDEITRQYWPAADLMNEYFERTRLVGEAMRSGESNA